MTLVVADDTGAEWVFIGGLCWPRVCYSCHGNACFGEGAARSTVDVTSQRQRRT